MGQPALQAAADVVICRQPARPRVARLHPNACGDRELPDAATRPAAPAARDTRRTVANSRLASRGRNVLVTGDAKSGKSWVAGLLCEQLILHGYCVCAIDPEGDYSSLEALPGVTVLGGDDPPPTPRELLRALRYPDRSVVIDLSRLPHDDEAALHPRSLAGAERAAAPDRPAAPHPARRSALLPARRRTHRNCSTSSERLYGRHLLRLTAAPGPARRHRVMIVTCESNPAEMEALRARCAGCGEIDAPRLAMLGHLKVGQAVALPITEETGGELRLFTIAPRLTPHVRHREKYVDVPVSRIGRSSSTPTVNPHTGFVRCGSSWPSWRTRRRHCWRAISCAAISRAGSAMCSAIVRWPASSRRSKSDTGPDHAGKPYRKLPVQCVADTTWPKTKSSPSHIKMARALKGRHSRFARVRISSSASLACPVRSSTRLGFESCCLILPANWLVPRLLSVRIMRIGVLDRRRRRSWPQRRPLEPW